LSFQLLRDSISGWNKEGCEPSLLIILEHVLFKPPILGNLCRFGNSFGCSTVRIGAQVTSIVDIGSDYKCIINLVLTCPRGACR
jgi:hypothetical protein